MTRVGTDTDQTVTVVTLADSRFALPLAVLVRSILENLSAGLRLSLRVIDGGLSLDAREALLASWPADRLAVAWLRPDFGPLPQLPVWGGRIPPLTYARIFLDAYLPANCRRALVLDSDSLVLTDLGRLLREPMHGQTLLAPRDAFLSNPPGRKVLDEPGCDPARPYFSAAAMVVDVERWRADNIAARTARFVARHPAFLSAYDQDALNAVLTGKWRELDPRWQVQPRALGLPVSAASGLDAAVRARAARDAWLVHFSGRLKPWLYRGPSAFDDIFYEVLDRTAWEGWRPPLGVRSIAYRLYDGRLRRWAYPLERRMNGLLGHMTRREVRVRDGRLTSGLT